MFIETVSGELIPVSEIVRVYTPRKGSFAHVQTRDGGTHATYWSSDIVERACCPVIPALPGYEYLVAYREEDGMGVARTPIIGWRVRPNGLDAITPEDHDVSTVKYPDGQVAVLGDQTYANEAEWLAAMEDEILAAEQKARDEAAE